jgi:HTH-type transcriptional regulator/antitoxin HigA
MTQFNPDWVTAPGETIADILEERSISVQSFGKRMKEPTHIIQGILDGSKPIDSDIAAKLERVLGSSMDFWLKRQEQYEDRKKKLGL